MVPVADTREHEPMPIASRGPEGERRILCLSTEQLSPILERKRLSFDQRIIPRIPLDALLIDILDKANEFVPSSAGSILLDDPIQKFEETAFRELIFVCCFGPTADGVLGLRVPIDRGIVGSVYRTGSSQITNDAYQASEFDGDCDRRTGYLTRSVLCVAIRIGNSVCGVIELMNKSDGTEYRDSERELLEIFAQYISSTIQNALDAKKIERMVRLDDLTGLANDRATHERLPLDVADHLRSGAPLSVLFLDLDRFKEINDTHGHLAGSTTLAEFGRLLRETVQHPAATMARYGGDEFVLLLPGAGSDTAQAIAEEIRRATAAHVFLEGPWGEDESPLALRGIITASIGVSTLDGPPRSNLSRGDQVRLGIRLLQCADQAMYASKSGGKNRVTCRPMDQSTCCGAAKPA
jgi:diguanylate cyclase (GGDEF)-like protein